MWIQPCPTPQSEAWKTESHPDDERARGRIGGERERARDPGPVARRCGGDPVRWFRRRTPGEWQTHEPRDPVDHGRSCPGLRRSRRVGLAPAAHLAGGGRRRSRRRRRSAHVQHRRGRPRRGRRSAAAGDRRQPSTLPEERRPAAVRAHRRGRQVDRRHRRRRLGGRGGFWYRGGHTSDFATRRGPTGREGRGTHGGSAGRVRRRCYPRARCRCSPRALVPSEGGRVLRGGGECRHGAAADPRLELRMA